MSRRSAELSYEDRCKLDNGIHPLCMQQERLGRWAQAFGAVVRIIAIQLTEEPSEATRELIDQLNARIALLDDQVNQVDARLAEWRSWRPENRDCLHHVPGGCESCRAKRVAVNAPFAKLGANAVCGGGNLPAVGIRRGGQLMGRCQLCAFECYAGELLSRDRPPRHKPARSP